MSLFSVMTKKDKALLVEADKINDPIEWSLLFNLAEKAESKEVISKLENKAKRLYHLE